MQNSFLYLDIFSGWVKNLSILVNLKNSHIVGRKVPLLSDCSLAQYLKIYRVQLLD